MNVVLDASALLAWLFRETGADQVADFLATGDCAMSSVNWAEVSAKLIDRGYPESQFTSLLDALELELVPFDASLATQTGLLRTATRSVGLSLGDRACLALAQARQASAITADRAWMGLAKGLDLTIVCVR